MASEAHLIILNQGVESWNQWRKDNPDVVPDLTSTDLSYADLSHADLSHADLSHTTLNHATLNSTNFNFADLSHATLNFATLNFATLNFTQLLVAKLSHTDLSNASLYEANLITADLSHTDLNDATLIAATLRNANLRDAALIAADLRNADLYNANLSGANLRDANLSRTDLSNANFSQTDLSNANLSAVQAVKTDFTEATLTGACIENWNIKSGAKLNAVICNYVYLQNEGQDRRPPTGNFSLGEFAQIFQNSNSAAELIFYEHINWLAFAYSFRQFEHKNEAVQLAIRSIENKGDGIITVSVNVSPNEAQARFQDEFMQAYEFAQTELGPQYQAQLENKDEYINQLILTTEKLNIKQTFNPAVSNPMANSQGEPPTRQPNTAVSETPSLAEVLTKIQSKLQALQIDNPNATEVEKQQFVSAAIPLTLRQHAANALRKSGQAMIEEFIDHPNVTLTIEMIEGWQNTED